MKDIALINKEIENREKNKFLKNKKEFINENEILQNLHEDSAFMGWE